MTHPLTGADIRALAYAGAVVLSPHFDDACFSLGSLLCTLQTGVLVNVFNRSMHLPNAGMKGSSEDMELQAAKVRGDEDRVFADRCLMRRCQLDGAEPGFWGRRPNDLSGLAQDVANMESAVMAQLSQLALGAAQRPWLMVPMAVGQHVNHHAVHQIVLKHQTQLQSAFRLAFYEDLPYAHVPWARARAIRRFKAQWGPNMVRATWATTWAQKKTLVMGYASQHRRMPSFWKYRPATLWPVPCHEALWFKSEDLKGGLA